MNTKVKQRLRNCKRRIQRRLRPKTWPEQPRPMFQARNIHYDLAEKAQQQASQLEQGQGMNAETQKELRYATRRLTQKLEE